MPNIFLKYRTIFSVTAAVMAIKIFLLLWTGFHFTIVRPGNNWITIWDRWDAGIYETIATSAYNSININIVSWAFLSHYTPLYPMAMVVVSRLLQLPLANAGILISLVSIIAASITLYKLAYEEFKSERIAWLSVLFLNLYPTSYFTISVYAESLFLFLTILSFYCLKKKYYLASGLAGAGVILTRIGGVVLLPIYFLYIVYNYKRHSKFNVGFIYPFLLSLLGLGIHIVINKLYYGGYFYFLTSYDLETAKHLIIPFSQTFIDFFAIFKNSNFANQLFMVTRGWNALFTLFALIVTVIGIRKIKWEYTFYSLASILMFASLSWGISNARYTLSVFPIFIVLALTKNKILLSIFLVISVSLLLYFTQIFVSGGWAF